MNKMMRKVGSKAQKWLPNYTNWMMLSNKKRVKINNMLQ